MSVRKWIRIALVAATLVSFLSMTSAEDGNSAHVTYAKAGEVYKKAEIIRTGSGYQLLDEKGVPLYSAELSNGGGINLLDRDCQLVHAVSPEQLNIAASRLATLEAETN